MNKTYLNGRLTVSMSKGLEKLFGRNLLFKHIVTVELGGRKARFQIVNGNQDTSEEDISEAFNIIIHDAVLGTKNLEDFTADMSIYPQDITQDDIDFLKYCKKSLSRLKRIGITESDLESIEA